MKSLYIACMAVAALLFAGCRSGVNQQVLEREIRRQEDQIYALEDEIDDYEAQLQSMQYENLALKKQASTGDRGALDSPGAPMIEMPGAPAAAPRRRESTGNSGAPMKEPGVEIDLGEEFDPSSTPATGTSSASRVADQNVQRIVLNKQLTGGINHTGRGGDRGILVVFEPRNKAGQMLDLPGEVSIAVLDPLKPGPQTRIARWDFTAEEAQSHFGKTALGRGYHFELPWPSEAPVNRKLQVFVRYITPDGRKLLADMPIDVSPPTDREAKHWHSVPPGSRRSQAGSRGAAPPYVSASSRAQSDAAEQVPTAKFLDPPQIVPEDETNIRPGSSEMRSDDREDDGPMLSPDDREAAKKKRKDAKSARPVWSPYR